MSSAPPGLCSLAEPLGERLIGGNLGFQDVGMQNYRAAAPAGTTEIGRNLRGLDFADGGGEHSTAPRLLASPVRSVIDCSWVRRGGIRRGRRLRLPMPQ